MAHQFLLKIGFERPYCFILCCSRQVLLYVKITLLTYELAGDAFEILHRMYSETSVSNDKTYCTGMNICNFQALWLHNKLEKNRGFEQAFLGLGSVWKLEIMVKYCGIRMTML